MKAKRAGPTCPSDVRHFEDRLEDVSYFLSYKYPNQANMAQYEGWTATLAMALLTTCRTVLSDLHHLRGHE
jgi:hypothetical protein